MNFDISEKLSLAMHSSLNNRTEMLFTTVDTTLLIQLQSSQLPVVSVDMALFHI